MKVLKKNAIKAYKAFNSNWTCREFQYEVGKTYKYKGSIALCERGFHSCIDLADCFNFYGFNPVYTKFAEVLIWGEVLEADTKHCSSCIKIVREIPWEEVLCICNAGNNNSGLKNSGDNNSGLKNSGNWNSGYWNSGNRNSGYWNTGDRNSGYCNSGNWNSGNWNSGNWNSGNWNSGYFNTPKQNQMFCFNKVTEKQNIEFPDFLRFNLTEWISAYKMTPEEKEKHPKYAVTDGYLKTYSYKEAFHKSFEEAKKQPNWKIQLAKLKAIPNFDYAIFEEISGISKEELESEE